MWPPSHRGSCMAGPGTGSSRFNGQRTGSRPEKAVPERCWSVLDHIEQTTYVRGWAYCGQTKPTTPLLLLNNNETLDVHVKKQQWSISLWPLAEELLPLFTSISLFQKNRKTKKCNSATNIHTVSLLHVENHGLLIKHSSVMKYLL